MSYLQSIMLYKYCNAGCFICQRFFALKRNGLKYKNGNLCETEQKKDVETVQKQKERVNHVRNHCRVCKSYCENLFFVYDKLDELD